MNRFSNAWEIKISYNIPSSALMVIIIYPFNWFCCLFLLSLQYGGFSKFPGEMSELYHSYYGFTAFSLLEEPHLLSLFSELGITEIAALGV